MTHPYGGYAHMGCSCATCAPLRLSNVQRRALETIACCGDTSQDPRARIGLRFLKEGTLRALSRRGLVIQDEKSAGYWPDGRSRSRAVWVLTDAGTHVLDVLAPPKPITDECEECSGTGECQQHCEGCGEPLTEANWKSENETYACNECIARDS